MIEPTPEDIGRKVIYRMGWTGLEEEGVITFFNDKFVFVRYGSDAGSKGTQRGDLNWAVMTPGDLAQLQERQDAE